MVDTPKQPTWTNIKKVLSELSRDELICTIGDLYKLRKENSNFLRSRYCQNSLTLKYYQEIIRNNAFPDDETGRVSLTNARAAISDYQKATGDAIGVAELTVLFVELCATAIDQYGMDYRYLTSTVREWEKAIKMVILLPRERYIELWERLEKLLLSLNKLGKGLVYYVDEAMYNASPYPEEKDYLKNLVRQIEENMDKW